MQKILMCLLGFTCLLGGEERAAPSLAALIASLEDPTFVLTDLEREYLFAHAFDGTFESIEAKIAFETNHEEAKVLLEHLWSKAAGIFYPNFSDNPLICDGEKKLTKPYLLPLNSPIKPIVDQLFANKRVTMDQYTLAEAGFDIFSSRPRSFIQVARHPELPGYVFKIYLDTLLEEKRNIPGWKWFVFRCRGADRIAKIIKKRNYNLLAVPRKWIYPLPLNPTVPQEPGYIQKHTVLIADEMPLIASEENYARWKDTLTKEHLKQVYGVISRAACVRSRPDNIWFMPDGRLALIDTEYSESKPDLYTIRTFLRPDLLKYWDRLLKKGGE